jgi:glutamate racemase
MNKPSDLSICQSKNNNHINQAIGVFDSGIGGLSIAHCIQQNLPSEKLIYVADSQFAPYGGKSSTEIIKRVNRIADWLIKQQVKAIVVACNTATVSAIDQLRLRVSIPIIGVEPAIKPAALQSKTKKVALLVTEATALNNRFLSLVDKHKNGADIYIQPCAGLVELIEQGLHESEQCRKILSQFLQPLLPKNIDTLVLGCTHYPFVRSVIKGIVGEKISIMDTAQPVTEQLIRQLELNNLLISSKQAPIHRFFTSNKTSDQENLMSTLFGQNISLLRFPQI